MTEAGPPRDPTVSWETLLSAAEQLISLPTLDEQQAHLEQTVSALFQGRARFWRAEAAFLLPRASLSSAGQAAQALPPIVEQAFQARAALQTADPPALALPLIAHTLLLGMLHIERAPGLAFHPEERRQLERLAALAAVAMEVNRQAGVKQWRIEQLALVRSVSAQIANLLDVDLLARRVTQLIRDTFGYYYVGIYTYEPNQEILRFRAAAQAVPGEVISEIEVRLGQGLVGQAAQTGEEMLAENVAADPRYRFIETLSQTQAEIALPLRVENRILGVLDVQSDQVRAFHEMDLLVLRALADHISLAVEGARLYQSERRRSEYLEAIAEVSRVITSILDQDALLDAVVEVIHKRFGYPFVHLFTVHPGRRQVVYRAGSGARSRPMRDQQVSYPLDSPTGIIPWVARSGKTRLASDVSQDPVYVPSVLQPEHTRSELAIPLMFGDEVLGVLDLQSDQVDIFTQDDCNLLEALADSISIAMRNATMFRSEQWRRQVAESMRDVAGLLSAEVALDALLEAILTQLERNLPCDVVAIWLLDGAQEDGQPALRLAAVHGSNKEDLRRVAEIAPESHALLLQAVQQGAPNLRKSTDPVGPLGRVLGYPPDYSSVAAPLRAGNRQLGVIAIAHHQSGRYGHEAISMVSTFASYAAVAIENNRLYTSAQEQAWISTVMLQVAEAVQNLNSVPDLAEAVVRLTPMLAGVERVALLLRVSPEDEFQLMAEHNLDPVEHVDLSTRRLRPADKPVLAQLLALRQPLLLERGQPGLSSLAQPPDSPRVLFPLIARGEILGALYVQASAQHNGAQPKQMAMVQGIVQQTAVAIENIRLLEAKQEEAYVTAVLLQVAQAVVSQNELDDIMDTIVQIMPILVGIDVCQLYLWDEEAQLFMAAHSAARRGDAPIVREAFSPGDFPILDHVFHTDAQLVLPLGSGAFEPPEAWPGLRPPAQPLDPQRTMNAAGSVLMAFPLSVKGDVYGVLLAEDAGTAPGFRPRRLEIISGIAQQAALAIQNDRLNREMVGRERLEREVQLAREIQRNFLPASLAQPAGWDLDVRWRPARQVGGDFYDCFELPGGRLGLVIADVSDKGMPAALYMTVARTLIRAAAQEENSPAQALTRVNNLLLMDEQSGMFVTAMYAILTPESGRVVYTNAGHNLPIWRSARTNELRRLSKGGTALGVLEDPQLKDRVISLEHDDLLVFFTDGVTEAFSAGSELFGEERLLDTLSRMPRKAISAGDALLQIDRDLSTFIGDAPPSDDVTLLAVHRRSGG